MPDHSETLTVINATGAQAFRANQNGQVWVGGPTIPGDLVVHGQDDRFSFRVDGESGVVLAKHVRVQGDDVSVDVRGEDGGQSFRAEQNGDVRVGGPTVTGDLRVYGPNQGVSLRVDGDNDMVFAKHIQVQSENGLFDLGGSHKHTAQLSFANPDGTLGTLLRRGFLSLNNDVGHRFFVVLPELRQVAVGIDTDGANLVIGKKDGAKGAIDLSAGKAFSAEVTLFEATKQTIKLNASAPSASIGGVSIAGQPASIVAGGDSTDDGWKSGGSLSLFRNDGDLSGEHADQAVVHINGQTGDVVVGGNGSDGDLVLYRRDGDRAKRPRSHEATIHLDGEQANIFAGGSGANGEFFLFDADGGRTGTNRADASVLISAAQPVARPSNRIVLRAGDSALVLGGDETPGSVYVRNGAGEDTIQLKGDGGNIFLGGNGQDGDLVAKNGDGDEMIHLHGDSGDIELQGQIRIKNWTIEVPDYVFDPSYALQDLSELEEYVTAERHLPGIPPAEELRRTGVDVGSFVMKLLAKIEELTLYATQQDRRIRRLEQCVSRLVSQSSQETDA